VAHFAHLGGFAGGLLYLKLRERLGAAARFRVAAAPRAPKTAGTTDLARWRAINQADLHPLNRAELDRILDKISASGMESLTAGERTFLERFSQRH
jgi:hypothetical protein